MPDLGEAIAVTMPEDFAEDFARWRDDRVTRLVLRALGRAAEAQRKAWDDASWHGGVVRGDQLRDTLMELRVRADCYRAIGDMTPDTIAAWLVEDMASE